MLKHLDEVRQMAKRKTPKTIQTIAKKTVGRAEKRARALPARASARSSFNLADYAAPGAAVIGSGLLAAAGILLKDQLGHILVSAARNVVSSGVAARLAARNVASTASRELEVENLLAHIGLQRRRVPVLAAGFGAVAGVVAGSALAMWLGPLARGAIKATKSTTGVEPSPSAPQQEPTVEHRVTQNGAS